MSTRYIWGQYTVSTEVYPITQYRETYDTGSGDYRSNMESGDRWYLWDDYIFNSNTGSFITTSGKYWTVGSGWAGKALGSGYVEPMSADVGYNAKYSLIYSNVWIGRDYVFGIGFCSEASAWRGYYARLYQSQGYDEVKGSFIGYVSSNSSGTYPTNGKKSGYWYVYQGTDNIDPKAVAIPDTIEGGSYITITVTPSSSSQSGPAVSYIYQYKFGDDGAWTTLTTSSATQYSLSVPMDTPSVQVRVQAKDASKFTSTTYVYSKTVEVINGEPPTITSPLGNSPADLGEVTEPFVFSYTVSDPDYGDRATVTEKLIAGSASTTRTRQNVSPGSTFECELGADEATFQKIPNEEESTIEIVAVDSHDRQSNTYQVTFTKYVDEVTITLQKPLRVSGDITQGFISVTSNIPIDATFWVKVTNNADDDEPVWQDVTEEIRSEEKFYFINAKADKGSAFNFMLYAKRGSSNVSGYIDTIIGMFA